jgi:hypothetical protein
LFAWGKGMGPLSTKPTSRQGEVLGSGFHVWSSKLFCRYRERKDNIYILHHSKLQAATHKIYTDILYAHEM